MATEPSKTSRRASPLLLLAAVALAVAVVWLLSERNARQWWIVPEDGKVVVKKGILFVTGKAAFQSSDPEVARTYAPVVPPPGAPLPAESAYDDRAGLDQALFELLAGWAREDVRSQQVDRMDRARGWLHRAERLAGISAAQREELRVLRSETAFGEAVEHLRQGAAALQRAQDALRLAAGAAGPVAVEATALARSLEPVAGATGQLMLEASRFSAERFGASRAAGTGGPSGAGAATPTPAPSATPASAPTPAPTPAPTTAPAPQAPKETPRP